MFDFNFGGEIRLWRTLLTKSFLNCAELKKQALKDIKSDFDLEKGGDSLSPMVLYTIVSALTGLLPLKKP